MQKKKVYVGCALTQVPLYLMEYVINELRTKLGEKYEVLEFVGLTEGTPEDVFIRDSDCVIDCDLFVAICDYPSLGLGIELGIAYATQKATLALANTNTEKVSRMAQGIRARNPNFVFKRYGSFSEIPELVDEAFATIPSLQG